MSNFLNALNNIIWGPPLIILMIVTGVYFTLRTKFFQVRHLGYIFSRTLGRLFHRTDESADEKACSLPTKPLPLPWAARWASATLRAWPLP